MDRPTFRMSESGKCPRALSAKLLGYEPAPAPDWLEGAAEEGRWHEDRLITELTREGELIEDRQKELSLSFPNFELLGHIDGIIVSGDDTPNILLEIKSMSQFEFDRWMRDKFVAFPHYEAQLACYLVATGLPTALYIVKNRSSGYQNRQTYFMSSLVATYNDTIAKLTRVAQATELLEANFDPQSIECRRCEYKHLCVPEARELTPIEDTGLSAAADDWRNGKRLVSEGQELINKAKEIFEEHTRATNILRWQHSGLAIQLVHYKESKQYPKANLLKVFTEQQLEPCIEIKEAFDQLRISDITKEANDG